jgi:MarR family transcriptional regulator, lower aerobic nicotinate degradation pathway regulator
MLKTFMAANRSFSPSRQKIMGFVLNKAAETFNRQMDAVTSVYGLTIKQYGILGLLQTEGPQAQIVLSEKVGLDRTSVMTTIDRLEGRGLVERQLDPNDRRKHSVTLTETGRQLLQMGSAQLRATEEKFLEVLSADEQKQLHQMLIKLIQPR